jgi:NAD(P)H-nitrite reductase large subunit/NAD-dependent dihydropyrimidine dehydrogenase PreA subunit
MMRPVLVFHRDHCLACRGCELACSVAHSAGPSHTLEAALAEQFPPRRRVVLSAGADGIEALRCEQCLEPLCAFACKSGALRRDPRSGRVIMDEARCVACFLCLAVCPSGIRPDPARDRVVRCDVCADRQTPACVEACPTGALRAHTPPDERLRSQFRDHVLVVGSSAAGMAACEAAREHAPECSITLVTPDASPYSRPLLSYALAGRLEPGQTDWRAADYLEHELGVHVLAGRRAVQLESELGALTLDDGEELGFERLILATGARAAGLSIPGAGLAGVFALRNAEDLIAISEWRRETPGQPRAVVLGGGNVGLQACEAFLERGLCVTVVAASPYLLSQMVDAEAGRRLADLFRAHGVEVRTGRDAVAVTGNGRVQAVRLDSGELLPADLVLVAKGIMPNVEWLRGSGLRMGRGISVDLSGRTSVPGIFAAGDCAEAPDPLTGRPAIAGIWPVAYEMGRAAGSTAVGIERTSAGAVRLNASRFFGESIVAVGEVRPERLEGARAEIPVNREGAYRKLVYRNGRLAGALLYGDIAGAGTYYRQYREGAY